MGKKGDKKIGYSVRIKESKLSEVKRLSYENECNPSDIINDAIDCYIDNGKYVKSLNIYNGLMELHDYIDDVSDVELKKILSVKVEGIVCLL